MYSALKVEPRLNILHSIFHTERAELINIDPEGGHRFIEESFQTSPTPKAVVCVEHSHATTFGVVLITFIRTPTSASLQLVLQQKLSSVRNKAFQIAHWLNEIYHLTLSQATSLET
jgi:hypothetical protein